jgi:hypothetical protein
MNHGVTEAGFTTKQQRHRDDWNEIFLGYHKETEAQRGADLKTDSGTKNLKTENAIVGQPE